jgi:hypothetical protein
MRGRQRPKTQRQDRSAHDSALHVSISWICRRLRRLDRYVLEGVCDGILDDDLVAAVVGDGIVEELRGAGV